MPEQVPSGDINTKIIVSLQAWAGAYCVGIPHNLLTVADSAAFCIGIENRSLSGSASSYLPEAEM